MLDMHHCTAIWGGIQRTCVLILQEFMLRFNLYSKKSTSQVL